MTIKIRRSSQSTQSYHNKVNQWDGWEQHRFPSHFGRQTAGKNLPHNGGNIINNRNVLNTERNNLIKTERNTNRGEHCSFQKSKQIDRNARTICNGEKSEPLIIEWDCIDSFHEFAIYMDKLNPICPAEHLDTPEKLMKLLVF